MNEAPNLANATPGFLVDELGAVREKLKELKKLEGIYREALKGRWPGNAMHVEGETFSASMTVATQMRLDTQKIRSTMPQDWVKEHSTEIEFQQFRTQKLI